MAKRKILVTGALGQIGSELTMELRRIYGDDNVIASSRRKKEGHENVMESGVFEILDVTDGERISEIVKKHNVNTIIHLAALLSAVAEDKPAAAWNINM
ncbi:MAG TPA: NAD-dependent epimerase/dehydratase family protein, partial [Tissierellales bacterium]|nr:NAD-dependent epimerase/dehydratase family protein [Tissierellales bacterium]